MEKSLEDYSVGTGELTNFGNIPEQLWCTLYSITDRVLGVGSELMSVGIFKLR